MTGQDVDLILLVLLNFSLIAFLAYRETLMMREREHLVHRIMAKNLPEALQADKILEDKPEKPEKPSEFVLSSDLDDDQFDKMIEGINNG